jgi:hypothetical protein
MRWPLENGGFGSCLKRSLQERRIDAWRRALPAMDSTSICQTIAALAVGMRYTLSFGHQVVFMV